MSIIKLDNKGQISAEYLLLLVVILTIFLFMINNFVGPTINANNNVSAVSDAKIVVNDIANAINVVYANGPESKRTVTFNLPNSMNLTFTDNSVSTVVNNLNYQSKGVTSTSKTVTAPLNYGGTIDPVTLTSADHWCTVQVYWNSSTNNISVKQI